jgi:hypothetical protein
VCGGIKFFVTGRNLAIKLRIFCAHFQIVSTKNLPNRAKRSEKILEQAVLSGFDLDWQRNAFSQI